MKESKNQDLLNLIYPTIFIVVFGAVCINILLAMNGKLPTAINGFDLAIVILASFRFIRALTYDKMFKVVRDWAHYLPDGRERKYGFVRTIYDLISCPWCTGIYTSIFALFLYFLSPAYWFILLIFSVSGVACFIEIVINLIATHYEVADARLDKIEESRGQSKVGS